MKMTWSEFGKGHGLGSNKSLVNVREAMWFGLK